ncbi:PH domain-containing protein [Actinoplanes xinjiangensis]|uniref:PH (Pleckstrin Homology) domain-containing protein n=1 Tax=Actinoplanes xinjiangensis TaxID=512350 RepID=A0A316FYN1_9ACTN|nr:PH domain-containing protein [Actinoplanes xinjiangensis]PWK52650.1 PH (Pleckstrin Homology) domain-containing protein [Actinoplanes xinjiangensis]GIF36653.1 hypothetical protein Axi01nite_09640 [Actinoplanes xinjiangensis]
MLNKLFTQVGRHPTSFLLVCLALATAVGLLDREDRIVSSVVLVAVVGLVILADYRFHPANLTVRDEPRAFDLTNHVVNLFSLGGCIFLAISQLVEFGVGIARGDESGSVALVVGLVAIGATAVGGVQVLRPAGVRLRPDGIEDVRTFGTLFVPWEAFAGVDYPAVAYGRNRLLLTCSAPGAVRKTGWRVYGPLLPVPGNDPVFLSRVIHEYAHRPELRPAIGAAAERDRLIAAWAGPPAVP